MNASSRPAIPSTTWRWRGEIFLDRFAPNDHIHPIPTEAADPGRIRPPLRARAEIVLWRGRSRSRAAAVRSRADGRRPRRPHRLAVSRLSGALRRPSAGSSACPRPMSSPSCRGSRLTLPALASCREMLFEVAGAEKRAILTRLLAGENLPANRARSIGETVLLVDRAAAAGELSWPIDRANRPAR